MRRALAHGFHVRILDVNVVLEACCTPALANVPRKAAFVSRPVDSMIEFGCDGRITASGGGAEEGPVTGDKDQYGYDYSQLHSLRFE